jgi:Arc/MetJ-type ribon-helix-helix transcriptional regulator
MRKRIKYVTVSIPEGIARDIDKLIEELGYWPSRGAFVREACMEKIWVERRKLKELKETTEETDQSLRGL